MPAQIREVQIRDIVEKFPELLTVEKGPTDLRVQGLNAAAAANPHELIFISTPQHLEEALQSESPAWVVQKSLLTKIPEGRATILSTNAVPLCMALIGTTFFPITRNRVPIESHGLVSPSAQISPTAKIGKGCLIGPGAVISDDVVIGDGSRIGANAVIEPGVVIGKNCTIHPLVFIGHGCVLGDRVEIKPSSVIGGEGFGYGQDTKFNHYRIHHYGRVVLEDDVNIGSNVLIDRGTYLDSRIGRGARIDNHCHFGHNIEIGANTLVTASMITAGSVKIGSNCVFGGRTTVTGHIEIADNVHIGGMAGITKSITKPGKYGGFPLQPLSESLRTRGALLKVPKMVKQMKLIMSKLGMDSSELNQKGDE